MGEAERFAYLPSDHRQEAAGFRPILPISLTHHGNSVKTWGLVDSGAAVNVMPFQIGLDLGASWREQSVSITLTGNLAQFEARILVVSAVIGGFKPIRLAFAWTQATNLPLILGQVNFFMEFDICFYRSQQVFDIQIATR